MDPEENQSPPTTLSKKTLDVLRAIKNIGGWTRGDSNGNDPFSPSSKPAFGPHRDYGKMPKSPYLDYAEPLKLPLGYTIENATSLCLLGNLRAGPVIRGGPAGLGVSLGGGKAYEYCGKER